MNNEIYTRAFKLAEALHVGQKYAGADYLFGHLIPVAHETLCHLPEDLSEEAKQHALAAGILHDILEDTECTEDMLRDIEMPEEVIAAVKLVTKPLNYVLIEYLTGIRKNPLAFAVKKADMLTNLTTSLRNNDLRRIRKYTSQLQTLTCEIE